MDETQVTPVSPKFKDITGQRFGRLLVVERAQDHVQPSGQRKTRWRCACDCGQETIAQANQLRGGHTQSCGCYNGMRRHGMYRSATYKSWQHMLRRCDNKNDLNWPKYGGRGICVCDRWKGSFEAFFEDMGERPANCTLDRIDVNGDYEPANCRWANRRTQHRNTRTNRWWFLDGKRVCSSELAETLGVKRATLNGWVHQGLSLEKIIQRSEAHHGRAGSVQASCPLGSPGESEGGR